MRSPLKLVLNFQHQNVWETADDIEICRAMKTLENWRDRLNKVIKQGRVIDAICIDTPLSNEQIGHYKSLLQQTKCDVAKTLEQVKAQDKERIIFADLPGKPEVVKLPIFHGNGSEHFVKKLSREIALSRMTNLSNFAKTAFEVKQRS